MLVIAISFVFSLSLFALAVWLISRANLLRKMQLRVAAHRSPEGYAFRQYRAIMRRNGWMGAMAAAMTLGVCLAMSLVQLTYRAD